MKLKNKMFFAMALCFSTCSFADTELMCPAGSEIKHTPGEEWKAQAPKGWDIAIREPNSSTDTATKDYSWTEIPGSVPLNQTYSYIWHRNSDKTPPKSFNLSCHYYFTTEGRFPVMLTLSKDVTNVQVDESKIIIGYNTAFGHSTRWNSCDTTANNPAKCKLPVLN